jgi:WD40 repeat protein
VLVVGPSGLTALELSTGKVRWAIKLSSFPSYFTLNQAALTRDGRLLATVANFNVSESRVILRDVATGAELAWLDGHRGPVQRLAFSPDGRRLATASFDTTALVWDVTRYQKQARARRLRLSAGELEAAWAALAGDLVKSKEDENEADRIDDAGTSPSGR